MEQGIFVGQGKARLSRLVAWLGLTSALVLISAGPVPAQMTTSGAFDVDHSGVASFSIPVQVVPGTGGMVPALTLNYSSQAGNGPLGVGWSLDGISVITRCSRTMAQDGARGGVNYDANDRFCMDGQRLMVQDGGAYGTAGSTYRTELDSFSKVTAVGQAGPAGAGPSSFTVRTKSGLILEYGNTTDSKVLASVDGPVRVWAVSRITDTVGNYMAFTYESPVAGEHRPLRIDYTGNAVTGLAPYASVRFVYAARTDKIVAYDRGLKTEINNRMTNIRVYYGSSTVVTDYQLTYDYSPATKASRIVKVEQCTGSGSGKVCLPPVNLTWSGTAPQSLITTWAGTTPAPSWGVVNNWTTDAPTDAFFQFADVNADGLPDAVKYRPSTGVLTIYRNLGNLTFAPAQSITLSQAGTMGGTPADRSFNLVDLNNDSGADVILYNPEAAKISVVLITSAGNGSLILDPKPEYSFASAPRVMNFPSNITKSGEERPFILNFSDFNNDGNADIFIAVPDDCENYPTESVGRSRLALGNGAGGFATVQPVGPKICYAFKYYPPGSYSYNNFSISMYPTQLLFADLNGDGQREYNFIMRGGDRYCMASFPSSGTATVPGNLFDKIDFQREAPFAGFYPPVEEMKVYTCKDTTLSSYVYTMWNGHTNSVYEKAFLIGEGLDFNQDGVGDFASFNPCTSSNCNFQMGLGRGDGTYERSLVNLTFGQFDKYYWSSVGDLNGDGRPDIYGVSFEGNMAVTVAYGMADGTYSAVNTYSLIGGDPSNRWVEFIDLNGDGIAELFVHTIEGSQGRVFIGRQQGTLPDRVTAFTDGLGSSVTVTYASLTDPGVYEKGTSAVAGQYSILAPVPVVREIATSDGIGGLRRTRYTYGDLRVEPLGRGQLGFGWVREIQLETDVETLTEYSHSWPFTGIVTRKWLKIPPSPGQVRQDKQQLSNGYGCLSVPASPQAGTCTVAPGKIYFPYVRTMVEDTWDLDGTVMPRVTTETAYDSFGNATEIAVDTGDGFSKTTVNTYDNDTTNWLIGRLRTTTVTATAPALP